MEYTSPANRVLYKLTQVIWFILGLIELLLLFRFALKLIGANPGAPFTSFIYNVSNIFAGPFISVFKVTYVEQNVFEWTTLLAMFVYWLIAVLLVELLLMGRDIPKREAEKRLDEME
jgi:hypothetical protein